MMATSVADPQQAAELFSRFAAQQQQQGFPLLNQLGFGGLLPFGGFDQQALLNPDFAQQAAQAVQAAAAASQAEQAPAPKKPKRKKASAPRWLKEEDVRLKSIVERMRESNVPEDDSFWARVSEELGTTREATHCAHRWKNMLDPSLVKGSWSEEEDAKLVSLVGKYGAKNWSSIATHLDGRIGKQCRERWHNTLNPELKKGPWSAEETRVLIQAHEKYGNKWAIIAKLLDGRTDNHCKNHWNSMLAKKANAMKQASKDTDSSAKRKRKSAQAQMVRATTQAASPAASPPSATPQGKGKGKGKGKRSKVAAQSNTKPTTSARGKRRVAGARAKRSTATSKQQSPSSIAAAVAAASMDPSTTITAPNADELAAKLHMKPLDGAEEDGFAPGFGIKVHESPATVNTLQQPTMSYDITPAGERQDYEAIAKSLQQALEGSAHLGYGSPMLPALLQSPKFAKYPYSPQTPFLFHPDFSSHVVAAPPFPQSVAAAATGSPVPATSSAFPDTSPHVSPSKLLSRRGKKLRNVKANGTTSAEETPASPQTPKAQVMGAQGQLFASPGALLSGFKSGNRDRLSAFLNFSPNPAAFAFSPFLNSPSTMFMGPPHPDPTTPRDFKRN
eukprot:m.246483 g.246483  ORF g.246483 m.246483 type:complete len:617 (-) comp15379_c0_seq1:490-2340(-)